MATQRRTTAPPAGIQTANAPPLALPLSFLVAGPLAFVLVNLVLLLAGGTLLI